MDKRHGYGVYKYVKTNERYEGEWVNGEKQGQGTYFYSNGGKYQGQWLKNQKHGKGAYYYPSGSVYEGDWQDDKVNGFGIQIVKDSYRYEGQFQNGLKSGQGIFIFQDESSYEGNFLNDFINGSGNMNYANGDIYQGEFFNDMRNGNGTYQYANGDIYDGEWKDDKKQGVGTLEMQTGDIYEGEWNEGKKNGTGAYKFANGDSYEGCFVNGLRYGKGIYTWSDKSFYKGDWEQVQMIKPGSGSSKVAKQNLEQISAKISSGTIIDFEELHQKSLHLKIKNYIKNKIALNSTKAIFQDFKPNLYHETARDKYLDVFNAYKKHDKVELMKHLSVPLYDIFKTSIKKNRPLPFTLYDELIDISVVMARVYSLDKHLNSRANTWHQITCQFVFHDKLLKQDIKKYNVFERRQIENTIPNSWRICHFD
ncbi:phosphatidylinositol-4-phosphate 5-kinase, putative [Ichthyophthirius multifiliis]|uniref:Phosphatidylinositol-4-phosphate 5-kinase, putative n=1 Tax=Ichthyophthirius multifiliis TaxID=5932 RepID=G0QMT6_ICHMU|nr:phosphatidylinositol-4-phosphate 5-kinase, putative [Ichthyophthirius multifiliis]EGR33489.1 phosphatidylinositol-4-phosphate 5-kinase, putative [Ichthyophthirius multifiliis]|eukprot:XP_004037475.1 phosphatidylinositol-4-phosphate 5-kinase, putative [Ichthyophthirius multifiliis]